MKKTSRSGICKAKHIIKAVIYLYLEKEKGKVNLK